MSFGGTEAERPDPEAVERARRFCGGRPGVRVLDQTNPRIPLTLPEPA